MAGAVGVVDRGGGQAGNAGVCRIRRRCGVDALGRLRDQRLRDREFDPQVERTRDRPLAAGVCVRASRWPCSWY